MLAFPKIYDFNGSWNISESLYFLLHRGIDSIDLKPCHTYVTMELSEYFFRFSHKEVASMSVLGRILFTGQVLRFSKVSRKLISSQIFASNALQQTPPPPANKTFKILIWRHGMKLENRSAAHFVTDQGYNLPHPGTCTPILIPRGTLGRAVQWGDCQERGI